MNKIKLLAIAFAFSAIPSLVMAQNDRNDLYNVANIKRYAEVNQATTWNKNLRSTRTVKSVLKEFKR